MTKRRQPIKKGKLTYFADEAQFPLFFTEHLHNTVNRLAETLPHTSISIYPDATIKTNGLPTGIACSSTLNSTILLPFVLRDPGCGYLIFKLKLNENFSPSWNQEAGQLLDNLTASKTFNEIKQQVLNDLGLNTIIHQGLRAIRANSMDVEINKFIQPYFEVGAQNVFLSSEEIESLTHDFMKVTNTIEIRKIAHIQNPEILNAHSIDGQDFIGFVHTGSYFFPELLGEKFVYQICEYAHKNHLFDLEDIRRGIVGVPLNTRLGKEYASWLKAAMNYALVSRYYSYAAIKRELEANFPCEITLINDNLHAGLFERKTACEPISYSTRGVQNVQKHSLSLLAGQRETIAALVIGGEQAEHYDNLLAHGTGYHICDGFDYDKAFTLEAKQYYLSEAQHTFYNSTPRFEECLPYTHSLLSALNFFEEIGLVKSLAYLSPFINIQSEWLKGLN